MRVSFDQAVACKSLDEVHALVERESRVTPWYTAHYILFSCTGDPAAAIATLRGDVRQQNSGDVVWLDFPEIEKRPIRGRRKKTHPAGIAALVRTHAPGIFAFVTGSPHEFIEGQLLRLLSGWADDLSPAFLTRDESICVLNALERAVPGAMIQSSRTVGYSRTDRAKIDYEITHVKRIYEKAAASRDLVASIRFQVVHSKYKRLLDATIDRYCHLRFHRGEIKLFAVLVNEAAQQCANRHAFFKGRSPQAYDATPRPVDLLYKDGLLATREARVQLLDAIGEHSSWVINVHHHNPYLHSTVVNVADGSLVDVYVTEENRISLVPGPNASQHALTDITRRIFDSIDDAQVLEHVEQRIRLEDVFTDPAS
jgi:hypothetical protein